MSTAYSPSTGRHVEVETLDPEKFRSKPKLAARFRRAESAFVMADLKTFALVCRAFNCFGPFVWAWINYEAWRTKSQTVKVTNEALAVYGVDRKAKHKALQTLARAGLLTITRNGRRAPSVTLKG